MAVQEDIADSSQFPPPLSPSGRGSGGNRRKFATPRVILALLLREMSSRYGNSPGGYVWAIIEPLGMIALFSVGFSLILRTPSLGNSFILFFASGYMVFTQYKVISNVVEKGLSFSRPLLRYPAVTWLDALLARFILNAMTNIVNTFLILGGILLLSESTVSINFVPILVAIGLASLLGAGFGALNCLLTGLFPVWDNVVKILNRPLMIMSGVLYIVEDLPAQAGELLTWNPLVHVTGLMRAGIYSTYHPQYISIEYVVFVALIPLAISLFFLRTYSSQIINQD